MPWEISIYLLFIMEWTENTYFLSEAATLFLFNALCRSVLA